MKKVLILSFFLVASCKLPHRANASLESNISETQPVSYVFLSTDFGNAANATIAKISKAIPADVKIVYLTNTDLPNSAHQINLKIPASVLTVDNEATRSQAGVWESAWTRDYIPEFVQLDDGSVRIVKFEYFYPNANAVGRYVADQFIGVKEIVEIPYIIEGGNLVVDENRNLFISERAIHNTLLWKRADNLSDAKFAELERVLNTVPWQVPTDITEFYQLKEEMTATLKSALNVKTITWLPALNYERGFTVDSTGHLDIFMKYLGNNQMLVGDIVIPDIAFSTEIQNRLAAQKAQLDGVAHLLSDRNYSVIRVPFAVVENNRRVELYSYTNSLIFSHAAIVPNYYTENKNPNVFVSDQEKAKQAALRVFDSNANRIYENLHLSVQSIEAATVWGYGGQIHCLTKHVPKLTGVQLKP